MYDGSGKAVVRSNQPGLPLTDLSGSEFEVGTPTSEEKSIKTRHKESSHGCT